MKKINLKNKLELRRTTVRVLSAAQLHEVAGGAAGKPKPDIPTSRHNNPNCGGSLAEVEVECGTRIA
jgi:hypothetical protein